MIFKRAKLLLLTTALLFATSCSEQSRLNDRILSKKLIGTWKKTLKRGHSIVYVTTRFQSNGIFRTDAKKVYNSNIQTRLYARGSWRVSNGYLIEHTTDSNFDHIGSRTRDKIIAITNRQFAYKTRKGKIFTYTKK